MDSIIDEATATRIVQFEKERVLPGTSIAVVVFTVLGALLVALGITLIVAENWDDIPRTGRIIISFLPILLGQVLLLLSIFRYPGSLAWKEASASFLLLTTGATLALISQVFQLQGTLSEFLLLWIVCVAPLVFISRASASAILFIILGSWFTILAYWQPVNTWHVLWILAVPILFFLLYIASQESKRAVAIAFGWLIPLSLALSLGHAFSHTESWAFIAYMAFFQISILFSTHRWIAHPTGWKTGMDFIGFIGSVVMLFMLTKKFFLREITEELKWAELFSQPESWIVLILLVGVWLFLLLKSSEKGRIVQYLFPAFLLSLGISFADVDAGLIFSNLFVLLFSVNMISRGIRNKVLLTLNTGLLMFSVLVIMRFFDYNLSFVIRGIAFLIIGGLFFVANRMVLRRGKEEEHAA